MSLPGRLDNLEDSRSRRLAADGVSERPRDQEASRIFVSMNPIRPKTRSREKADALEVRRLQLDLD